MAPPAGVIKVVLSGALPGGDRWSSGFWMRDTGVNSEGTANAQAQLIYGTITASDASGVLHTMSQTYWSAQVTLDIVNVYSYAGGSTIAQYVGAYAPTTPLAGSGNPTLPNQVCLVTSLRTGLAGRRNRGRMYIPVNQAGLDGTGQIALASATQVNTGWQTFFNDVNESDAGGIVVVSITGSVAHDVTAIKTDTRLDIQRRRAEQQAITGASTLSVTPHGT